MNLEKIEQEVISISKQVGDFIMKEGSSFDRDKIELKSRFNNLVSYVDKEAERMLVERLHEILPEAGFVTEEGTVDSSQSQEYTWIIDPLDGTTNFLHGLPIYSISIGLARSQAMVLGVVHEMNRDECFHAIEGEPAYLNNEIIKVSAVESIQESLLATGFPYNRFEKSETYLEIIKEFLDKTHGIRRLGSAAIDLAYVACGRIEGFFEHNLNPWDVAAGTFIVQQAGGVVSDFQGGGNFLYGGELIASNKSIHPAMKQLIASHWYKD